MSVTADLPTSARLEAQPAAAGRSSGFIIGPVADSCLIIGAPLVGLFIGTPLFCFPDSIFSCEIMGTPRDLRQVFMTSFIAAHLVLVYFRSHANLEIFRQYPFRFTVVPAALLVATTLSPWVMGIVGLVAIWWDVYHSSLQTFGFGRIYDAKRKNSPVAGRRLDYWMNLLLYAGPVLAGAIFVDHLRQSREQLGFLSAERNLVADLLVRQGPDFLERHQWYLAAAVIAVGLPFVLFYLWSYYRLSRQGYQVSWQKVWLLVITGSVSIFMWGFRPFIDAFWVMNFFHALQYFAIVGYMERQNLSRIFRLDSFSFGKAAALVWVVVICMLYGFWSGFYATGVWATGLVLTTSIMHFWYDGFIWSVKKRQV